MEKLCNCANERYWQFFGKSVHLQGKIERFSGRARAMKIFAWSRKLGRRKLFEGLGNELSFHFKERLGVEEAKVLAVLKYGVGRFKNQGFGSLRVKS